MKKVNFYTTVSVLSIFLVNTVCANPDGREERGTYSLRRTPTTEAIVEKKTVGGQVVHVANHKEIINFAPSQPNTSGYMPKVFVIDGAFHPDNHKENLTESYFSAAPKQGTAEHILARELAKRDNHANHVTDTLLGISKHSKLRVHDIESKSMVSYQQSTDDQIVAALQQAIRSKADFVNISLRIGDSTSISEKVRAAFLSVKKAGIVVYKSIGNEGDTTGKTPYTKHLAKLVAEMNGSLRLVANLSYDNNGNEKIHPCSNRAGSAKNYTVSAPGTNILAQGASGPVVKSGSSMAAPIALGVAITVKYAYPTLPNRQVADIVDKSARKTALGSGKVLQPEIYGHGVVDMKAALELAHQVVHHGASSSPFPTFVEKAASLYATAKPIISQGIESAKVIAGGIASTVKSTAIAAVKAATPVVSSAIKSVSSWFGY